MTTRARARAAMRGMAADAEGPRLRPRRRRLGARRIAHICLRLVEWCRGAVHRRRSGVGFIAGARASSPRRHARPDPNLAPGARRGALRHRSRTDVYHDDSRGVGLGFKGLTVRDAAGRTVLSAPSGKLGLDPFAAALLDVRVRRLELDGLDLRLRVAADGALSLAVASDLGVTPILSPARPWRGRGPATAALVRAAAETMAGAAQGRPAHARQRSFRG